jgi:hypothetical protein
LYLSWKSFQTASQALGGAAPGVVAGSAASTSAT